MIARHEVLRSYVKEVDGQPRQEILPSLRIALPVIDLTHLPNEQAEIEARRLSAVDARQLYDLAIAPLMRATLVKLADDDHVFILNFHHIIADGSSLAIFYKELAALYERSAGRQNGVIAKSASTVCRLRRMATGVAQVSVIRHATRLLESSTRRACRNLVALPTDFDRPFDPILPRRQIGPKLSDGADLSR